MLLDLAEGIVPLLLLEGRFCSTIVLQDFIDFEVLVFVAQILGCFFYLLQSQIHLAARKHRATEDDPYLQVLLCKSSDFMVSTNLIQDASTLLLTTICICTSVRLAFKQQGQESVMYLMFWRGAFTLIPYIFWLVLICRGT